MKTILKVLVLFLVGANTLKLGLEQPNLAEMRSSQNEFIHQLSLAVPAKKVMSEKESQEM